MTAGAVPGADKTPARQAAMLDGIGASATRKRHPSEYPRPYPYWLRGKVNRIRR